jgi:hypothetical protein
MLLSVEENRGNEKIACQCRWTLSLSLSEWCLFVLMSWVSLSHSPAHIYSNFTCIYLRTISFCSRCCAIYGAWENRLLWLSMPNGNSNVKNFLVLLYANEIDFMHDVLHASLNDSLSLDFMAHFLVADAKRYYFLYYCISGVTSIHSNGNNTISS